MTLKLISAIALLVATTAAAETRPQPGAGDPRIQTVLYDPEQVVRLDVVAGYQLTLELGSGEHIENVAVGDSGAWQVTPNKRGDRLFIKVSAGGGTTNLTVVTDARTYAFTLAPGGDIAGLAYTVRFRYPTPPTTMALQALKPTSATYKLGGTRALRPALVSDDGTRTFISFLDDQTMPAVFALDEEGHEKLIDGVVRDGRYVIDSIANHLVFRLGKRTATATRAPQLKGH